MGFNMLKNTKDTYSNLCLEKKIDLWPFLVKIALFCPFQKDPFYTV
jgi:hypothetical protein